MTDQTEAKMNTSGVFKNVEEWKATAGGQLMYLLQPGNSIEDIKDIITEHVYRVVVKCIPRMKTDHLQPYYCETLIHLKLLFDSGLMYLDTDNKVALNFDPKVLDAFIGQYAQEYKNLVKLYVEL